MLAHPYYAEIGDGDGNEKLSRDVWTGDEGTRVKL